MRILVALSSGLLLLATSARFTLTQEAPLQSETGRKILSKTLPIYPELARKMNLEGVIKLRVTVAPNGTVKYMERLGGSPVLAKAAENAIYKWRWAQTREESKELVEMRFHPE